MKTIYKKFKDSAIENKKQQIVFWKVGASWKSENYKNFLERVDNFAEGLFSVGVKSNERVAILSENRPEWLLSDLAINKLGAISVPVHITSNKPLLEYILDNSSSGFLIASKKLFEKNFDVLEKWNGKIILLDRIESYDGDIIFAKRLEKIGFDKLKNKENKALASEAKKDLASIIYTSGTTGRPKGVMLTNNNFLFNVASATKIIKVSNRDKFLSFLPLSHVLERMAGSYIPIFNGASIAYAEDTTKLQDNLKEVKPTILICVPKIFERIYEKIFFKAKSSKGFKKNLFFWALKQTEGSIRFKIADALVFKKLRRLFGGRMRFAVSGGASLNEKINKFFCKAGVKIIEGYGLTETAPLISVNSLDKIKIGSVGQIIHGIDVRIAKDKEIIVNGQNVMRGYLDNEEATRKVLDSDGWFKTGDLGFLDSKNFLTIIGRKNDRIVLSNGKNIDPERIEGLINLSPIIEQSVVIGHKRKNLCALIIVDKEKIKDGDEDSLVKKELDKVKEKLANYEAIRNFKIIKEPFTIEAGDLTPTLKIRRKKIEAKYEDLINRMYSK